MTPRTSGQYPTVDIGHDRYVYMPDPVPVWTPNGALEAPQLVNVRKTYPGLPMVDAIAELSREKPRKRTLTFGESYQIRQALERTKNHEIESDFIVGDCEATSTLAVMPLGRVVKGRRESYIEGFVVERPRIEADRKRGLGRGTEIEYNMSTDGGGIPLSRFRYEVPLPLNDGGLPMPIRQMPGIFDDFLDIVYGMKGARRRLPSCAQLCWPDVGEQIEALGPDTDRVLISCMRSGRQFFDTDSPDLRKFGADGGWSPFMAMPYREALVDTEELKTQKDLLKALERSSHSNG